MKKIISVAFCVISTLCIIVFATFGEYSEISNYDIVSGIAIDLQDDKWTVTCEICVPSSDNDFASSVTYVTGTGYTLDNAFSNAALKSANELYTDSTGLYLISDTAKGNNCLYEYLKGDTVNLRAVAVWTECPAKDIFKSDDSENERSKSLAIAKKIKTYCRKNNAKTPGIIELLKDSDYVFVSEQKTPERTGLRDE